MKWVRWMSPTGLVASLWHIQRDDFGTLYCTVCNRQAQVILDTFDGPDPYVKPFMGKDMDPTAYGKCIQCRKTMGLP